MDNALAWVKALAREVYQGLTFTGGRFSNTKAFSSVAYVTATWAVIHQELAGTLTTEMMLAYLGTVAGHNVLLRRWTKPVVEGSDETSRKAPE